MYGQVSRNEAIELATKFGDSIEGEVESILDKLRSTSAEAVDEANAHGKSSLEADSIRNTYAAQVLATLEVLKKMCTDALREEGVLPMTRVQPDTSMTNPDD